MKTYTTNEVLEILNVSSVTLKSVVRFKDTSSGKYKRQLYKPELGTPGSGGRQQWTDKDVRLLSEYFNALKSVKIAVRKLNPRSVELQ